MTKTAVVILNWNGKKFLNDFLPSVVASANSDTKVYVIDNASTDESLSFLETNFKDVSIIRLDKNYGFTGGYNRGLKNISAKYFVLLNSDVQVADGWLNPLEELLDNDANIAACQPKILDFAHPEHFEYAGAVGGFIDYMGFPFCRGRIFNAIEKDENQYEKPLQVFWATGACLFIRSDAYWQANGFDENFFAHMEEIDLCWRLQLMGYEIFNHPASKVYHVGGGTLNKYSSQKTYLNFRNNRMMLFKNAGERHLESILLRRTILDFVAAFSFLFTGGFSHSKAVIKAYFDYKKWKKQSASIRAEIQKNRKVQSPDCMYQRSIIVQYYLKGRKKFSELNFMKSHSS